MGSFILAGIVLAVVSTGIVIMMRLLAGDSRDNVDRIAEEVWATHTRELSQQKASIETYGHATDIKRDLLNVLPDPAKRKAENIRWELKINTAGDQADGKGTLHNDAIATITLLDLKAADGSDEVAQRNYNLTRFYHHNLQKHLTYSEAFTSDEQRLRMSAKSSVRKMLEDVSQWSQKAQDEYEYNHCPPEPYVEMK